MDKKSRNKYLVKSDIVRKKRIKFVCIWDMEKPWICEGFKSREQMMKVHPEFTKVGIDKILSGKQKTHLGYHILVTDN